MSTSNAQASASKTRSYRLGRRAEKQEQTRLRIVEAAVELHATVGPARTSIAQIAERADIQRHTFYAHFPDERSLLMACSGLTLERNPLPDVERWAAFGPGIDRIRRGLDEFYAWYARNERLVACVLRDAEFHEPTREIVQLRMGPAFERASELLGQDLGVRARALIVVALDFACWQVLSRTVDDPAALMADAITKLDV